MQLTHPNAGLEATINFVPLSLTINCMKWFLLTAANMGMEEDPNLRGIYFLCWKRMAQKSIKEKEYAFVDLTVE